MRVVHSNPPGPMVAVVDQDSVGVYDVRNGRRLGMIKQRLRPESVILNPAGTYVAGLALAQPTMGLAPQPMPAPGVANTTCVYSIVDGREVARLPVAMPNVPGQGPHVWFSGASQVIARGPRRNRAERRSRQLKLMLPPKTFSIDASLTDAVSPSGKFIATAQATKLNLNQLDDGSLAGEMKFPRRIIDVKTMAFSPDGTTLAALLEEGMTGWHLVAWNMSGGELQSDVQIVPPRATVWTTDTFQWLADSKGVLIGDDLIDVASGKIFYSVQHPTAGRGGRAGHAGQLAGPGTV